MTAAAIPNSSRWGVPVLLSAAIAVSIAVLVYARYLLHQNRIDPAIFFGGTPPARLETLLSVRVPGGELGEFFDSSTKQKLSLMLVSRPSAATETVSVPGIIKLIDQDRLGKTGMPEVNALLLKYASAQFNVLAAGNVAPTEIPVAGAAIAAERFETTRSANYLMGVVNLADQQLLFLGLRKGQAVDSQVIGELLERIPTLAQRVHAHPQ